MQSIFKSEDKLAKRLWIFQCEEMVIEKSKQGYGYKYAPLDVIIPALKPVIKKCGIGFVHQTFNLEGNIYLTTKIFSCDDLNDYLECSSIVDNSISFKGMNKVQAEGALLTYYRRYHLSMLLGLTSEDDTDASKNPKANKNDDNNKGKQATDYVKVFTNLLNQNQDKTKIMASFNAYKSKMKPKEVEIIHSLIVDKFN